MEQTDLVTIDPALDAMCEFPWTFLLVKTVTVLVQRVEDFQPTVVELAVG